MNLNSPGYEILESAPGSGIWYNNTVCQDNLPAPTTPDVEFFACYENDALTRIFNNLEWDWSPFAAGSIINKINIRKLLLKYSKILQVRSMVLHIKYP